MNLKYLGDALDFWKAAFLEILRRSHRGRRAVKILPMFTDDAWGGDDRHAYVRLLGARPSDLLTADRLRGRRAAYFDKVKNRDVDVFLDPDTGVALTKAKPKHVRPEEVHQLLSSRNVVAVYQHRPQAVPARDWLRRYKKVLDRKRGTRVIGYYSAQVGMLFVTRSRERAERLRRALTRRLGVAAAKRLLR